MRNNELQHRDVRKEVELGSGVSAVTATPSGSVRGGEKKKKKRRRKNKMSPHEVRAYRRDFPGALLNTALHLQLGKSRRNAMITQMAASIRDARIVRHPEQISEEDIETVKATFDLHHFLQHYYRRGRKYWALLENEEERVPVTCVEVRPGDRCMVVLDRNNQEHEIFFENQKEVEHRVEDAEQRELRQLRENLARQDEKRVKLQARLDSILKQLQTTQYQLERESRKRSRVLERLTKLEEAYDDRRHKVSRVVGSVTSEELLHATTSGHRQCQCVDSGTSEAQ